MTEKTLPAPLVRAAAMPRSAKVLFAILARVRHGSIELTVPGGEKFAFPGAAPGPDAALRLHDWDVCGDILRSGDIGFAEAYLQGRWSTPDLAALLTVAALNQPVLEEALYGQWWGKLLYRLRHLLRANTRAGARRNIHAHYDLGNDFYSLWLDPSMTYSAALFGGYPDLTLEQAQRAKYDRILSRLGVQPGHTVLEIGCGWGGFAEHGARARGCSVHGITVSRRQLEFARKRMEAAGLGKQVSLDFCDYRDVRGRYDHIVSIEMYEAVGMRYWPAYFRTLHDRLAPGGTVALQAITIADERFERYRRGTDFIQQYIFPGGMLASPGEIGRQARRAGLAVRRTFAFGIDYAETLRRWSEAFNAAWPQLASMGYDHRFRRLWNFYLAYCEAGFRAGSTDVLQIELTHA